MITRVLCTDGTMAAWGYNFYGQIGDNTMTSRSLPTVANLSKLNAQQRLVAISSGGGASHGLGLVAFPCDPSLTQAALTNLVISEGVLSPTFSPTTCFYTSTADIDADSITVTPTVAGSGSVRVNGESVSPNGSSQPIPLVSGNNTITIAVTSLSGTATRAYSLTVTRPAASPVLAAIWNCATDIPVTASKYTATGKTITFSLNCILPEKELMVVRNTGPDFIHGQFSNLAQGQAVQLSYAGAICNLVANYYGGNGNDLVLTWAGTRVFAAGNNSYGQLGNGTTTNNTVPAPVNVAVDSGILLSKTVTAISAGESHSIALCSDGTIATWGNNSSGQLGDGSQTNRSAPIAVDTKIGSALFQKRIVAIAAGTFHTLALCSDGTLAAWGSNDRGQLGDNTTTDRSVPVCVDTTVSSALYGKTVVAMDAGRSHSLALCSDGSVAAWGYNLQGQLGDNTGTNSNIPVRVNKDVGSALYGKSVIAVAAGGTHSLALCTDGTVAAWGSNSSYMCLGDNTIITRLMPVAVYIQEESAIFGKTVVDIAAGCKINTNGSPADSHSMALCADGSVAAWGINSDGQAGFVDFGIDAYNLPFTAPMTPALLAGHADTLVSTVLDNLPQGITYYYRIRGTSIAGVNSSSTGSFHLAMLSGLASVFPTAPLDAQGYVFVKLDPLDIATGWRFVGEQQWRASGVPAGGLATGDRMIEFRPVPGYIQPPQETVGVVSGEAATFLDRTYYESPLLGSGGLTVTLKPDALADTGVAAATRAQWRLLGEDDSHWRDSGASLIGLSPGDYLIECKSVVGRTTPPATSALVRDGQTAALTITYTLADSITGTPPGLVPFETVSTDQSKPYAYVGQIRGDVGSSSGFVFKQRVVATAGHVVFDDGTLSAVTGLQWLFQRHRGTYEPKPQTPRGFYIFDGYAAQRAVENTPGTSSPQSQSLDAAAMYFPEDAGRGGYGGFLASDLDNNEFILLAAQKMLVGYPVDGITVSNQGRMFATPPANAVFARAFGHTYTTSDIRSSGGGSGGPLCIQYQNGAWYPAAIYLGGSNQTVVRSLDSQVIDLFNRAEVSGNGGDNNTGGGITHTSVTGNLNTTQPGSLQVLILPAGALAAGACWRLKPESSYRARGAQKSGLSSGSYVLELPALSGFQAPTQPSVAVTGGQLTTYTFTYANVLTPIESWRMDKFGITSSTGNAADDKDPDHDGQNNLAEYAAGTNPNDPADVLKVLTTQRSGATFVLTENGKAGRTYALQRRAYLATGDWTTVTTQGPLCADTSISLTDNAAPEGKAFYRIQVSAP